MDTVLVTGGTGYIGSHTCVELLNNGYHVLVLDNFSNSSFEPIKRVEKITGKKVKFYEGDLRNKELLRKIFKANNINAVIHFAGLKAVGESCAKPLEYYDNNLYGSIALFEIMNEFNTKKIIFSSSATVYGNNPLPYGEEMPYGIISNPYGRTKCMIEQILGDLSKSCSSWHTIILRYFNPIGAHQSGMIGEEPQGIPNNLMPYILKVAVGDFPELKVFGDDYETPDGTCIRDYIHVVDLAKGHIIALKSLLNSNNQGKNSEGINIYNLGTGKGYSVLELIKTFEKVSKIKIKYSITQRRDGDLPICFANVSKIERELGWKAKYNIEAMCEDSWRWIKNNPRGYKNV